MARVLGGLLDEHAALGGGLGERPLVDAGGQGHVQVQSGGGAAVAHLRQHSPSAAIVASRRAR